MQNVSFVHSTQTPVPVSQTGVAPEQLAFDVHGVGARTHSLRVLHVSPVGQSVAFTHSTQRPLAVHTGRVTFLQSVAERHCTHWPVWGLHRAGATHAG